MQNSGQIVLFRHGKVSRNVVLASLLLVVLPFIPAFMLGYFSRLGYVIFLVSYCALIILFDVIFLSLKLRQKIILEEGTLSYVNGKNKKTHTYGEISEASLLNQDSVKAEIVFLNGERWDFDIHKEAMTFMKSHGVEWSVKKM